MKILQRSLVLFLMLSCQPKRNSEQFQSQLASLNLTRGAITLCGAENASFGKVEFSLSCLEKVQADFNLATSLLHSFEYTESEKVFARIIDEDPDCLMAYWGVAMSNFHPLWAPPTKEELIKGASTVGLARTLESKSAKESEYLEAVGAMYDDWEKLSHKERLQKFEAAAQTIYQKYPEDTEARIFYALALRASSDPADKTFAKQRKAGDLLNSLFPDEPNHPGIAHYLIHTYDYPELAELALPAARRYASIAATSAHALHMPSHIFIRLGLWDEAVQSNTNSIAAAKCYAENSGMKGHWDEELHGMDYIVYAYLQQGRDDMANAQQEYLRSFDVVFPVNFKGAYTFAAIPTRLALERRNWTDAAALQLSPADFPWANYPWERSLVSFGRALGAVHMGKKEIAQGALDELMNSHASLMEKGMPYEANQVMIQVKAAEAWIKFSQGKKGDAITLMTESAKMEDASDKPPVTPGEVLPARELLADMYFEMGQWKQALEAYENDLTRHPGRFNGLYGAGRSAEKLGDEPKAKKYYQALLETAKLSDKQRPELATAELFLAKNM